MIRNLPTTQLIEQKPRKALKLDLINSKPYDQFEGNSEIDQEFAKELYTKVDNEQQTQPKQQSYMSINSQIASNRKIFEMISQQQLKFKKLSQNAPQKSPNTHQLSKKITKHQASLSPQVKIQQGTDNDQGGKQPKVQIKNQKQAKKKQKTEKEPSSNWKKFLEHRKDSTGENQKLAKNGSKTSIKDSPLEQTSKFVAMDCQFVKCGDQDQLARISIVSQHGQTLYDSYIKPPSKVTDFLTEITGITYTHIKHAPLWKNEIEKVKKILLGKILVGHTLHKDLEVSRLEGWKGISQKIDIAQFSEYKQKGGSKVVSLKRMALSFLNKNIQSGWHSSVQDAVATMDLFKINKRKILKEFKLI